MPPPRERFSSAAPAEAAVPAHGQLPAQAQPPARASMKPRKSLAGAALRINLPVDATGQCSANLWAPSAGQCIQLYLPHEEALRHLYR